VKTEVKKKKREPSSTKFFDDLIGCSLIF